MRATTEGKLCSKVANPWRSVLNRTGDDMAYLLVYDLDGRSDARRKMNHYLKCNAQLVQHSVWRFQDLAALLAAAECVLAAKGKVLAFIESDRILLTSGEVRHLLLCPK